MTQVVPHKYPIFAYALTARGSTRGSHNMMETRISTIKKITVALHTYAADFMHFVLFVKS